MDEADKARLAAFHAQRVARSAALERARRTSFHEALGTELMHNVTDERIAELETEVAALDHLIAMLEGSNA